MKKTKRKMTKEGKVLIIIAIFILVLGIAIGAGVTVAIAAALEEKEAPAPIVVIDGERAPEEIEEAEEEPAETPTAFYFASGYEKAFEPIDAALDPELQEYAFYLCEASDLSFPLVMAVMFRESGFRVDAVSADGRDFGLCQIRDVNLGWLQEELGTTDLLDPRQNIRAGVYILKRLEQKYRDPDKILMAYNRGEAGAALLWEQGIVETEYSRRVLASAEEFSLLYYEKNK